MKFEDQEIVFRCNHPLIESVTINFVYNRQDFSPHRFFVTENFPIQCDPNVNFTFIWQAPVEVTTGEELYAVTIQDSIGLADGLSGLVDIDEPVIEVLTPTESASILANASVPIRWTCNRIPMKHVLLRVFSVAFGDFPSELFLEEMVSTVCKSRDLSKFERRTQAENQQAAITRAELEDSMDDSFVNTWWWKSPEDWRASPWFRVQVIDTTHPSGRNVLGQSKSFRVLRKGQLPLPGDVDASGNTFLEEDTAEEVISPLS